MAEESAGCDNCIVLRSFWNFLFVLHNTSKSHTTQYIYLHPSVKGLSLCTYVTCCKCIYGN